ncbi:MAG: TonB-dependent receptor [Tannerella sp.]|jgi:outer membrane cobalamin receptor|nr:TonB-dependent receptor [Tannerella sp.]
MKGKIIRYASGIAILGAIVLQPVAAQQRAKHTVSGYVYDRASRETLPGANVVDRASGKGAVANGYGFYSLPLAEDDVSLHASYVGYGAGERQFGLTKDTVVDFYLDASGQLDEVVVEARHRAMTDVANTAPGALRISPAAIRTVPAILGEADLIKVLQQTPGVSAGTEGFSGLYVRGGNRDENLYLIDGNPVYDVNHLFGFFSTFNPDAIKSVEFYKGSFPARFGGRLSSVVNVRTKDGNMQDYRGTFTVGLISSKIQLEGPIVRDRASFSIAFRRTYLDLLTTPVLWVVNSRSKDEKNHFGYHFYDLNAKLNYRFSDRSRIYVNWYSGDDVFSGRQEWYSGSAGSDLDSEGFSVPGTEWTRNSYSENGAGWKWGNALASLNWNYVFSPQLFANMSAVYSRFHSDISVYEQSEDKRNGVVTDRSETEMHHNSGIRDVGYRMDFDWAPHPNHAVRFGSNYLFHTFRPEEYGLSTSNSREGTAPADAAERNGNRLTAHELSLHAEDEIDITARLRASAGMVFSLFRVEDRTYAGLQPRFSARYTLATDWSLKASYAVMNQYVHVLSLSTVSLPNDLWVPSTRSLPPMVSGQLSAGVYHELNRTWHFSIEAYHKTMDGLVEYRDGAAAFSSASAWETRVATGQGRAYGVELLVQKPEGRLTGWLGYCLSKADRYFRGREVNGGLRFPAKYDSRHRVNVAAGYRLSDRVDASATWTYGSGAWMTVGLESYEQLLLPGGSVSGKYALQNATRPSIVHYGARNNYRMSDYHRLDVGLNIARPKKNGHRGTWNISVYNAYCRNNPVFAYPTTVEGTDAQGHTVRRAVIEETSFLAIIPSISYTYTF